MRVALLLSLVTACSFSHGTVGSSDDTPDDALPPMVTWQIDSTSAKGTPATIKEWSDVLAAASIFTAPPTHMWPMQETSGSLADSIASTALAPLNGPSYAGSVDGWSRNAVGTVDTTINQGFTSTAVGNLDGTSHLLLLYVAIVSKPGGARSVAALGVNSDHRYAGITTLPAYQASGVGIPPSNGASNPGTTVHPVLIQVDFTHQRYVVFTDQEKLQATWVAPTGQGNQLVVGNGSYGAAPARYLYGALWTGAGAELGDSSVKALLQRLGWTVTGY